VRDPAIGPGARLRHGLQRPRTHRRRRATRPIFTPARRPTRDTSTQVKIPARGGKLPGYLPRSTRTPPPPRSSQRPRGRLVLPIFIPQGWPPAMSHLSGIEGSALCGPAFSQVARERQGRSNAFFVSLLHAVQAARPIRLLIIPVVRWRLAAQPSPSRVRDGRRSPPRAKGPPPPLR